MLRPWITCFVQSLQGLCLVIENHSDGVERAVDSWENCTTGWLRLNWTYWALESLSHLLNCLHRKENYHEEPPEIPWQHRNSRVATVIAWRVFLNEWLLHWNANSHWNTNHTPRLYLCSDEFVPDKFCFGWWRLQWYMKIAVGLLWIHL